MQDFRKLIGPMTVQPPAVSLAGSNVVVQASIESAVAALVKVGNCAREFE